jgi:ABC-type spermidine/putrescine transport system permease subunit II
VLMGILPMVFTGLSIWSSIAMWRFRPRGRALYTGLLAACFVITPFAPPVAISGLAQLALYGSGTIAGVLLAAIWWIPSIASQFDSARAA